EVIKTSWARLLYVVIQFSRIVFTISLSKSLRLNVRDELLTLKRFRFVVNCFCLFYLHSVLAHCGAVLLYSVSVTVCERPGKITGSAGLCQQLNIQ
ncbi:hypothetical protein, partial [Desulfosediminicola sp.]|uniref:hypothetical protein n=1 Tax=Desulfosediminicola sp. TaxID=2886825 RepID=UPI003AF24BC7